VTVVPGEFDKYGRLANSHDRYANTEVAYLVERMEAFHVLAILATNPRSDIDDAYFRRNRYEAQFTSPGGRR
jgi:hypothetical protein